MKVETSSVIISAVCFVSSICFSVSTGFARYFAGYSPQLDVEEQSRMLLALATGSFAAGISVLVALIAFIVGKRILGSRARLDS